MAALDYVIGLGANLGSPKRQFQAALARMREAGVIVRAVSPVYSSEAVGPPQPPYENAAARVASEREPPDMLSLLHAIERELGRVRRERWGPRTLDLDILWCEQPWASRGLTVPHPRLCERWFALKPLLDVAPELMPHFGPALRRLGGVPH